MTKGAQLTQCDQMVGSTRCVLDTGHYFRREHHFAIPAGIGPSDGKEWPCYGPEQDAYAMSTHRGAYAVAALGKRPGQWCRASRWVEIRASDLDGDHELVNAHSHAADRWQPWLSGASAARAMDRRMRRIYRLQAVRELRALGYCDLGDSGGG